MSRSEHAYNFAALESRWAAHMNANGIIDKEERKQFLRQAWIDENELENHKEQARKTIQDQIAEMEAALIAQGVTDEQERLEIILARMMEQEAQIQQPASGEGQAPPPPSYSVQSSDGTS